MLYRAVYLATFFEEANQAWGLTLQKIVYKISKSFDFIEITLISSDFNDFKYYNYLDNN